MIIDKIQPPNQCAFAAYNAGKLIDWSHADVKGLKQASADNNSMRSCDKLQQRDAAATQGQARACYTVSMMKIIKILAGHVVDLT